MAEVGHFDLYSIQISCFTMGILTIISYISYQGVNLDKLFKLPTSAPFFMGNIFIDIDDAESHIGL